MYSIRETRLVLWAQLLSAGLGLTLLYFLVSHFNFGFLGAAIAIAAQNVLMSLFMLLLAANNPAFRECWPGLRLGEAAAGWGGYLRLALPSCGLSLAEWWSFESVTIMMGLLGPVSLSANAVLNQVVDAVGSEHPVSHRQPHVRRSWCQWG